MAVRGWIRQSTQPEKNRRINAAAIARTHARRLFRLGSMAGKVVAARFPRIETQRRSQAATTAAQAPSNTARQQFAGRVGRRSGFAGGVAGGEGAGGDGLAAELGQETVE